LADSHISNYSDWRLPNNKELRSIVAHYRETPSMNIEVFEDFSGGFQWSSSTAAYNTETAWFIFFFQGGDSNLSPKDSTHDVRAVRGGQNQLLDHLVIWSPCQASSWETGNTMPIHWDTKDIPGNVKISLSRQGGKPDTFELITETPNDGEFYWPVQGKGSVNCMLKIEPLEAMDKWTQQSLFMITDFVPQNPTSNSHEINVYNTDNTIDIEWTAPEVWGRKINGYSILWDHIADTLPGKTITTRSLNITSPPLTEGNDHYVHIRVVDDQDHWANVAAHVGPFFIKIPDVISPKGLCINEIKANQIELTWHYMGDNLTYNVYRSDSENDFYIKCDPFGLADPEFLDTDVTTGKQYWYKVTALNALGEESLFSSPVSAQIDPQAGGGYLLFSPQPYQMQLSGLNATYQIQVIPEGGYSEDIVLSVYDLPLWMEANFSQNPVQLPGFAKLTVSIADIVSPDRYSFNVSAQGINRFENIELVLDVKNLSSKESAISSYIKSPQIYLHQSTEIYGNIIPKGINTTVSIYIQHETEEQPDVFKVNTGQDKSYHFTYKPDKTGVYTIFSTWNGDVIFDSAESPHLNMTVLRGKSKLTCQTPDKDISSDDMVQITGRLLLPTIGDAHIMLLKKYINNDDIVLERIENKIFTDPDGTYQYAVKLDKEGLWEIIACWEGNDQYMGVISDPLRLYPGLKAGKALIVAGGGLIENNLWSTTQYLTTKFYKLLLNRNFSKQMIYYISPDTYHNDETIMINDNTPSVSDIENYIKSLYQDTSQPGVNSDRPFIIYLADHGGNKAFKVNRGLEILQASQLDNWLDILQIQTGCSVYIILEACYSGTFVDVLAPSDHQNRVIISSTGNHVAIYDKDGRVSFSQYLFNELNAGYSLNQSFRQATEKLRNQRLFYSQFPHIYDGQNSELAQKSYIGGSFVIGDILPEIVDHTSTQSMAAGAHDLFAVVSDVERISRVWASIMPPDFQIPETSDDFDTPIIHLLEIQLDDVGNGRFEGSYIDFKRRGVYHVSFHCEDLSENVVSKEILLNVLDGTIPGDLDNSGNISLCDAIISLQDIAGMNVVVDTSARILCNGVIGPCEGIEILKEMVK
jgi:hypothetical protein